MTPAIPISEALADRNLLGAALGGDVASWRTWRVVLRAAFAEASLTDLEGRLYASATSTLLIFDRLR